MTPEQIAIVRKTWEIVAPAADQVAEVFYNRLFELEPAYKDLFKSDMRSQGRKLMAMLNTAVMSLDKLDTILPAVRDLAIRHVAYGVKNEDYDTVGAALLWTLQQGLGEDFTEEVKQAWVETYTTLAAAMIEAANSAAEGAAYSGAPQAH